MTRLHGREPVVVTIAEAHESDAASGESKPGGAEGKLSSETPKASLPDSKSHRPIMTADDLIPPADPAVRQSRPESADRISLKHAKAMLAGLTKPSIAKMVVITAVIGFIFGVSANGGTMVFATWPWLAMLGTIVGTGLASMGSSALNQWIERDTDGLMHRTRQRPLPSGQISAKAVLALGSGLVLAGLVILLATTNAWAMLVCAATAFLYVAVYTPLKRVTPWAMHIGTLPGALPPLIGYAAAAGAPAAGESSGLAGWLLFVLMAVWQIPHFLAIAWVHRLDYARAGLPMLPVIDDERGTRTFRQIMWTSGLLIPIGLLPTILGVTGWIAGGLSLVVGLWFFAESIRLVRIRTVPAARRLFFVSLAYLPVILAVLVIDRV